MGCSSDSTTQGVRVNVRSEFLADSSSAQRGLWVFAYQVEIENLGERTVQLLSRRWVITDAAGEVQVVEGPGVVGETPVLGMHERFVYRSGCPLETPFGTMEGSYTMRYLDDDSRFDVDIGAFALCEPQTLN